MDEGDGVSSNLQIIADLEGVAELQARAIKVLATRLAELGDTETGKDEIAEADKAYRKAIGGDEWPDWPDVGENRGEGGNSNDMEEV